MKTNMSSQTRKLATVLRPLGRTEAKRAIETAVEHLRPELVRDGQSRFRALGAQLYVTRPRAKGNPIRLVEVRVIDYVNRRHLRVVIYGGRVLEVRPLYWQSAFSAEEIAEARAIVARDQRSRSIVRQRGAFSDPFSPGGHAPGERRIGLRYLVRRKTVAVLLAEVEVDLIEQRVTATHAAESSGGAHG
jgi:hypothetical protein